jgi:D-amino-acid dehydrogenase
VRGDAFVCALGVMERRLREQFGIHTAVYPVKGFSATVPVVRADRAPRWAMIDESRRRTSRRSTTR